MDGMTVFLANSDQHVNIGKEKHSRNVSVYVRNPHLDLMEEDILYHLDLGTKTHNLPAMFGDIKFVCVGGSPNRMKAFAHFMQKELGHKGEDNDLKDICAGTDRYSMYKVGPVLSISHGMGIPSISIVLHELIKLLHHAKCCDVTIIRIGTSGGLGVEPGSVVITDVPVDSFFKPQFEQVILDRVVTRNTELDQDLASELLECSRGIKDFPTLMGHTMCTYDFYEGKRVFNPSTEILNHPGQGCPKYHVFPKGNWTFLAFSLKTFCFSSKKLKLKKQKVFKGKRPRQSSCPSPCGICF